MTEYVDYRIATDFTSMFGPIIGTVLSLLIGGIGVFLMSRKSDYYLAWIAFIPFLIWIPYFRIINRSLWNVILMVIPIVNIIFGIIWAIEIQRVFGRNKWMVILVFLVPGFAFFYYIYLGISTNVKFEGYKYI